MKKFIEMRESVIDFKFKSEIEKLNELKEKEMGYHTLL